MERKFIPNIYTRFLSKVDVKAFDPLQCWLWKGAGKGNGYGNVNIDGKTSTAHSVAYELFVGRVPKGLEVCHMCDNRWCVNPDHLYVGTRVENMDDCHSRGRATGGRRKHLKENQVQEIRRQLLAGVEPRRISALTGVGYETVTAISKGRSYGGIS